MWTARHDKNDMILALAPINPAFQICWEVEGGGGLRSLACSIGRLAKRSFKFPSLLDPAGGPTGEKKKTTPCARQVHPMVTGGGDVTKNSKTHDPNGSFG